MGTDRVFAAELQALRPQVGQGSSAANLTARARRLGRDGQPPRGPLPPGAGRLLAALLAAGARRRARHRRARRRRSPAASWRSAIDNPVVVSTGSADGPAGRVQRQLPRRAGRLRPRLPRDRRRRRRLDLRAPQRPLPRPGAQPRPAAVPRRRPRRRQRPDDRAVHPGRDRLRAQAARGPGERRLDPVERDAGGPRVDGLERRPQAAPVGRRAHPRRRDRAADRRARPRPAHDDRRHRRARRPRRPPAPSYACCASTASARPAPTASCRPRSRPPSRWSPRVPSCPPSKK